MTLADYRATCIEAMAAAIHHRYFPLIAIPDWTAFVAADEALRSLNGIAHVNPTSASKEMARAIVGRTEIAAWKVAAQIGDLTNPPEQKT